ncbi:MAG TPA: Rieske (2Fe-2S) protein [Fibrobacteria bacterium]|nr:Rieske (2Fe-2S) protein [Fibrobacteria bacterium]
MSDESRQNPEQPESDDSRRTFLKVAAGALGACYAGGIGYPVYRYLASPVEKAESVAAVNEVTVPDATSIPRNAALMFKFGTKPAMLIHHEDDTWTAVSAVCTHLGCTAGYDPQEKRIFCPCHNGVYDAKTGANVSGPPPKPLDRFNVEIVEGKAVVSRA